MKGSHAGKKAGKKKMGGMTKGGGKGKKPKARKGKMRGY